MFAYVPVAVHVFVDICISIKLVVVLCHVIMGCDYTFLSLLIVCK